MQEESVYKTPFSEKVYELEAEGFTPYLNEIDEKWVTSTPCPACGGERAAYGWRGGRIYVAFAVCKKCGGWQEI
jgi:hypothetical protein